MRRRINLFSTRIHEFRFKRHCTNTAPCTTIHCIDGRKGIAQHKDFTSNLKLRLLFKEATCFYIIFTRELLHTRCIQRFFVIRFSHVDESLVPDRHNIRIGCTRFRTLTSHSSGLQRRCIITEHHRHQVHQLGFTVATHTNPCFISLFLIGTFQTGRQFTPHVRSQFRFGKEFLHEVIQFGVNISLFLIIRVILNVINGITVLCLVTSSHEGDEIGRLCFAKLHSISCTKIGRINWYSQIQNTICESDQVLISIQFQCKVFFIEDANTFFHDRIFEARLIERFFNFKEFFHTSFFVFSLCVSQCIS